MANDITKEIAKALQAKLDTEMPALEQIILDFPSPSQVLKYPSLSIQGSAPKFMPCAPYLFTQGATVDNEADVKWVSGQYEFELQLDFWCSSKEQRHQIFSSLQKAMASQMPVLGLSLSLTDYHGVFARYDLTSTEYEDSEAAAQRKEWRLIASVQAHCHSIVETVENIMEETETTVGLVAEILEE